MVWRILLTPPALRYVYEMVYDIVLEEKDAEGRQKEEVMSRIAPL
jgi:hypothetical protein